MLPTPSRDARTYLGTRLRGRNGSMTKLGPGVGLIPDLPGTVGKDCPPADAEAPSLGDWCAWEAKMPEPPQPTAARSQTATDQGPLHRWSMSPKQTVAESWICTAADGREC